MTEIAEFRSPLTAKGARLTLPRASWNDLRTLIEGSSSLGLDDGRHHSHVVTRWRSGVGVDAARFTLQPDTDITIDAARPVNREHAAHLGALLVFAVHAGQKVKVDLAPPAGHPGFTHPQDLRTRCAEWVVREFGWASDWMVRPSLHEESLEVRLPESLSEAPRLISDAYSSIFATTKEAGYEAVAGLFGAHDFDAAVAALASAGEAPTPYLAAHAALGALLAPGELR